MAQSAALLKAITGTAWEVFGDSLLDALGHKTGAVTPVSAVTPDYVGQEYFDTVAKVFYRATDLTNTGWTVIGDPGLSAAELSFLDGATAGTVVASKAVVVDSNADVTGFRNLTATNLKAGASGTAGTVDVFPTTASKGKLEFTCTDQTGNTTVTVTAAAMAAARTLTIPDPGAAASFVMSTGTSTATTATSTELNTVSGVTAGTVIASKAIVTDSGIKISGLLNLTFGAGTATVAPINFVSGTNLTTAAVGALEFDGVSFYATSVASARQVVGTEQFICLTANGPTDNNSLLDSSSAAAVFRTPTNGTLTVAAATSYFFEAVYKLSNTGTTSHTWSVLFGGAATFTSISYTAFAYTGTTSGVTITALSALQIAVATAVPVTAASTSATEFVTIYLRGIMRINAGGTLIPQMQASARPGATGTPAVIVLAGSYFRCWPVGSNTVASVGNWS